MQNIFPFSECLFWTYFLNYFSVMFWLWLEGLETAFQWILTDLTVTPSTTNTHIFLHSWSCVVAATWKETKHFWPQHDPFLMPSELLLKFPKDPQWVLLSYVLFVLHKAKLPGLQKHTKLPF